MLDGQTLLLVFLAIVLLFGTSKLPELARSLGKASGEFKKAQLETAEEVRKLEHPINEIKNIPQNSNKFEYPNARETKSMTQIMRLAEDLGIKTEGKDENMLLEEIREIATKGKLAKV